MDHFGLPFESSPAAIVASIDAPASISKPSIWPEVHAATCWEESIFSASHNAKDASSSVKSQVLLTSLPTPFKTT